MIPGRREGGAVQRNGVHQLFLTNQLWNPRLTRRHIEGKHGSGDQSQQEDLPDRDDTSLDQDRHD